MRIKVYYLTQNRFHNKILNQLNESYISFYEIVTSLDRLINNNDNSSSTNDNDLLEKVKNTKCVVVTVDDISALKEHVFQNFNTYISLLKTFGIEEILINNPTKQLKNLLANHNTVVFFDEVKSFEKIKLEDIQTIRNSFDKNIVGQNEAKDSIVKVLFRSFIRVSNKPVILFFYGNPGTGKTETAKFISKKLYGENTIHTEQMGMQFGENSLKYFKSPNISENSFSKRLINRVSNLILLDEFSLSAPYIQDTFYQLFDEGVYEDNNFKVPLENATIILTSNATSLDEISQEITPALYSRIDRFIHFKNFDLEEKNQIIKLTVENFFDNKNIKEEYLNKLEPE